MLSVYSNELKLQRKRWYNEPTGESLEITDVTFGDYVDGDPSVVEMVLHIGTEERLHTFMAPPTKLYQYFRVYGQVYSELMDECCDFCPNSKSAFVDYGFFIRTLANSDLAKKIVIESKKRQHRTREQVQVLALKRIRNNN